MSSTHQEQVNAVAVGTVYQWAAPIKLSNAGLKKACKAVGIHPWLVQASIVPGKGPLVSFASYKVSNRQRRIINAHARYLYKAVAKTANASGYNFK